MSGTCLLSKPKSSQFILVNPEVSVVNSTNFIKQLTLLTVSNLMYLRQIFPPSAFKDRKVEGIKVKVLKKNEDIPETQSMVTWIRASLEAIEKKRLKTMLLVIKQKENGPPVEIHTLNFTYENDDVTCEIRSESQTVKEMDKNSELPPLIKQATKQVISSILNLTASLPPLPSGVFVSVYHIVYHGPAFDNYMGDEQFNPIEDIDFNLPKDVRTLKLGKIKTNYATFSVTTKAAIHDDFENVIEWDEGDFVFSPAESELLDDTLPVAMDVEEANNLTKEISSVSLREDEVRCICECLDFDDVIKCESCSTYQHKACYKVGDIQEVEHICVTCNIETNPLRASIDPELIDVKARKTKALYRRALSLCLKLREVNPDILRAHFSIPTDTALELYKQMNLDGCFLPTSGKKSVINMDNLKNKVIIEYFKKTCRKTCNLLETEEVKRSTKKTRASKRNRIEEKENLPLLFEPGKKRGKYSCD